jgi:hypothetical protein
MNGNTNVNNSKNTARIDHGLLFKVSYCGIIFLEELNKTMKKYAMSRKVADSNPDEVIELFFN